MSSKGRKRQRRKEQEEEEEESTMEFESKWTPDSDVWIGSEVQNFVLKKEEMAPRLVKILREGPPRRAGNPSFVCLFRRSDGEEKTVEMNPSFLNSVPVYREKVKTFLLSRD